MAINDNAQPLLIAGVLPRTEYASLQDFVNDLPKVLKFPIDAVAIIKGAQGISGIKGDKGSRGEAGLPGVGITQVDQKITIPTSVTFVEFNAFVGWENATYQIRHTGQVGNANVGVPNYSPVNGIVGVGMVIAVYGIPTPTKIRCYFTFAGGITAVPDANHILQITYKSPT